MYDIESNVEVEVEVIGGRPKTAQLLRSNPFSSL